MDDIKLLMINMMNSNGVIDKWLRVATSTDLCDFSKATEAARRCYAAAGLPQPKRFLLCDSPWHSVAEATAMKNATGRPVRVQFKEKLMDPVAAIVDQALTVGMIRRRRMEIEGEIRRVSWDQIANPVLTEVNRLNQRYWEQFTGDDQIRDHVIAQLQGPHDAPKLALCDVLLEKPNAKGEIEPAAGLIELAKHSGWWAPYEHVCILQHRHAELHLEEGRIAHNESGMACRYRDGFGFYALHGIPVDEQIVMRPETQTIEQINGEKNQDIRSLRMERFGWQRYIKESGAQCIDRETNDISGTPEALYRLHDGSMRLVAGCVTGKIVTMGVPSGVETCQQAQLWLASGNKWNLIAAT